MRVFVTGASGFVGSAIVDELLKAGHHVLGLVRSEKGAEQVKAAGADVLLGDVNDIDILNKGATACDAVIHTAMNHDFSKFKQNCEDDRRVVTVLGDILNGTNKSLVITSGVALLAKDGVINENDVVTVSSDIIPRVATEEAVKVVATKGVNVYVVRLPPTVHGKGDHGFVPMIMNMALEKGQSAYAGDGSNQWSAVHRNDAAKLYRLIIEQQPLHKNFHAVAETGIAFKEIAEAIGEGLSLPVISVSGEDQLAHFGWFNHFATINCPSSSDISQHVLGWMPDGAGLLDDIQTNYFNK